MVEQDGIASGSRIRRIVLGTAALLVACGRSTSPDGDGRLPGSGGSEVGGASGASAGGRSGGSAPEGGEAGSEDGGRGGGNPGGAAGKGASGQTGLGGGSSVGGASTGAAAGQTAGTNASSGTGGVGGEMPLLLPEGCEPRAQSEDADKCSLGVFCGVEPNLTDCVRLSPDVWQCSCQLANNDRIYEIEGAPGIQACAVAAGLCSVDELELGDETCTESSSTSGLDECALELSCGTPITVDFAPNVRASLMEYGSGACGRGNGTVPFECSCEHDGGYHDYGLLAGSGTVACRPLVDFCMTEVEPNFDEPTVCFERYAESSSGACDLLWDCATPMRLTDEVSLAKVDPRYSNCTLEGPSSSSCYCSTRDTSFAFDVDAEPVADVCASSILNCDEGVSIQPLGQPDCQATSQTAGVDFCDADLSCAQPATVDGREIVSNGRLLVYCVQTAAAEPWWCSCASNQDSTIFEFGAPASDAWDVCSAAPAGCLERMAVFIGPYGEFMPPPYPVPPP